jgi:hypothetical protein
MNKSETTKELALALSKAQAEMPPAELNKVNPFLKNKYADLGSIIKASKPVLAKHGLSIAQMPTSNGDKIGITTILMHSSGEWIESTMMLPIGEAKGVSTAQAAGAIISYLRRYSLASALGMYAEEDVDGNGPTPKKRAPAKKKTNGSGKDKMSLETALEVTNSAGTAYGEIETEKLSYMANNIQKALKEKGLTPLDREQYEFKYDAITVILNHRNEEAK